MTQDVDIGLDISTSIVGVCVLEHKTNKLIDLFPIKMTSTKFNDIWDKSLFFETEIIKKINPTWTLKRIFVEEAMKRFAPGFSSADTIITLAKMNGIACFSMLKTYGVKPTFVNVNTGRAQLGIKINRKDKTKSTKEKVFEQVLLLNPSFSWEQHIAKTGKSVGKMVYDRHNQDMADAWVVCRSGQLLNP